MKVWTKVKVEQKNKTIDELIKAYINYLLKDNDLARIAAKYHIQEDEIEKVYEQLASRIAGILILYIGNDRKRLRDIINRYHGESAYLKQIFPEVEGYVER